MRSGDAGRGVSMASLKRRCLVLPTTSFHSAPAAGSFLSLVVLFASSLSISMRSGSSYALRAWRGSVVSTVRVFGDAVGGEVEQCPAPISQAATEFPFSILDITVTFPNEL